MRTGAQYRASLHDGRSVFFEGKQVGDLESHPLTAMAVGVVASGYDRVWVDGPDAVNPWMRPPRSVEELRERIPRYVETDMVADVTYQSLATILTAAPKIMSAQPANAEKMSAYVERSLQQDIRIAECITDAKGDRSRRPAEQADPDAYLRVVDRQADGLVIRGAKLHITGASFVHDLMVIPTKRMGSGEDDYSIACMVPVNSPGIHCVNSGFVVDGDRRDMPTTVERAMFDAIVVFDDVFVPHDRVFLDGSPELAAVFAHTLGLWERLGGLAGLVEQADRLVGLALLIAEANGTARIAHIREKVDDLAMYATMIRAGLEAAVVHAGTTEEGYVYPSELYTNAAKHFGASHFNQMVRHLHDVAGGSVATVVTNADFENPKVGPLLEKYYAGADTDGGARRAQIFRAIHDLTASSYGGWRQITNVQSGGGLFAQRLVARRSYDFERARRLALQAAGLPIDS